MDALADMKVAYGMSRGGPELDGVDGSADRRLLRPTTPWVTARDGILAAVIGGGSVVTVVGDDEVALTRIRETENLTAED